MKRSLVLALGGSALLAFALFAQHGTTTWDGVFTHAQAARGESLYQKQCGKCHGHTLDGDSVNPPLAGDEFRGNWTGQPLSNLFEKIQGTMPADHPGSLKREENADILAYVLSANKYPEGKAELGSDAESLKKIQFLASKP